MHFWFPSIKAPLPTPNTYLNDPPHTPSHCSMRKSARLNPAAPKGSGTIVDPVPEAPKKKGPGTIILVDRVPVNETEVFYQCRASAMSMTYENGMVYNNNSTVTYAYQPHGSGELMPDADTNTKISIHGTPREAVWRVLSGDGMLLRDPKPVQTVDSLLGSMLFNNQVQGFYAGQDALSEIRHGDILVVYPEDVFRSFDNGNATTARALIFVDEGPGHVRALLRDRDLMVGFRTRFERFMLNLTVTSTGGHTFPNYLIKGTVILDKARNDSELKQIRMRTFIMVLHKRYPFPGRFDDDVVRAIVNRL